MVFGFRIVISGDITEWIETYFSAGYGTNGNELWVSDGSQWAQIVVNLVEFQRNFVNAYITYQNEALK